MLTCLLNILYYTIKMAEKETPTDKKTLTPLGYIVFISLVTLCLYSLVNFFVGGIHWTIILAGVVLGFIIYTIK